MTDNQIAASALVFLGGFWAFMRTAFRRRPDSKPEALTSKWRADIEEEIRVGKREREDHRQELAEYRTRSEHRHELVMNMLSKIDISLAKADFAALLRTVERHEAWLIRLEARMDEHD